jgi:hypothetical protein
MQPMMRGVQIASARKNSTKKPFLSWVLNWSAREEMPEEHAAAAAICDIDLQAVFFRSQVISQSIIL